MRLKARFSFLKTRGELPYKTCRYVPTQRQWFLGLFGLKTGIHFAHFGLESAMVFVGIRERINVFMVSIPNE